jgi:hypothetical protein
MTTNWRDPAEYRDPTTKPDTWKWEFLRRNPNYRKGWDRYAAARLRRGRYSLGRSEGASPRYNHAMNTPQCPLDDEL